MKTSLMALFAVSTLAGCSSISVEECQTADWYQTGYRDGQDGNNPNIVNDYASDCAEANIVVDKVAWQKGFSQGTRLYCAPNNGYVVGSQGRTYYGVCDSDQFLKNYQLGKLEYQRQQRLTELNNQIADLDRQISSADKGDSKKLERLRAQRKDLARERSSLLTPNVNFRFDF